MTLLPQEIAAKMSVREYTLLVRDIEDLYHQKFGVVSIERLKEGVLCVVELENDIQHTVMVKAGK